MLKETTLERHEIAEYRCLQFEERDLLDQLTAIRNKKTDLKLEIEARTGIEDLAKYQIDPDTRVATLIAEVADKKKGKAG